MFTNEFIAGSIIAAAGCLSLYLAQCDWYRRALSGYWKQYNTPSGKVCANVQAVAVIVMGLALCFGFIKFN